jgi:hypothetical protein
MKNSQLFMIGTRGLGIKPYKEIFPFVDTVEELGCIVSCIGWYCELHC